MMAISGSVHIYKCVKKKKLLKLTVPPGKLKEECEMHKIRFGAYDKMLIKRGHADLLVRWMEDGYSRRVFIDVGTLNKQFCRVKDHNMLGFNGHHEMHNYIYTILLYSGRMKNYELAYSLGAEYACGLADNEKWDLFETKAKEFRDDMVGIPPLFYSGEKSVTDIHKSGQMRALLKRTFKTPLIESIRILHNLEYDLNCAIDHLWSDDCHLLPNSETIDFLFDKGYLRVEDFKRLPFDRIIEICVKIGIEGEAGELQCLFENGVVFEKQAMETLVFEAGTRNNHSVLHFLYDTKRLDISDLRFIVSEMIVEDGVHNLYDYTFEKSVYTTEHIQTCIDHKAWGCLLYILHQNPWEENKDDSTMISIKIGATLSNVEGQVQWFLDMLQKKMDKKEFHHTNCSKEEHSRIPRCGHQSFNDCVMMDWCHYGTKLLCQKHLKERIVATKMFLKLCNTIPKNISVLKQSRIERYFQRV